MQQPCRDPRLALTKAGGAPMNGEDNSKENARQAAWPSTSARCARVNARGECVCGSEGEGDEEDEEENNENPSENALNAMIANMNIDHDVAKSPTATSKRKLAFAQHCFSGSVISLNAFGSSLFKSASSM